ncbi:hypothetical protein HDU92_002095 [Lobulomyces angularis]|nr:hypothetical protein HDU92_002095 [Lobulomyces angularis]
MLFNSYFSVFVVINTVFAASIIFTDEITGCVFSSNEWSNDLDNAVWLRKEKYFFNQASIEMKSVLDTKLHPEFYFSLAREWLSCNLNQLNSASIDDFSKVAEHDAYIFLRENQNGPYDQWNADSTFGGLKLGNLYTILFNYNNGIKINGLSRRNTGNNPPPCNSPSTTTSSTSSQTITSTHSSTKPNSSTSFVTTSTEVSSEASTKSTTAETLTSTDISSETSTTTIISSETSTSTSASSETSTSTNASSETSTSTNTSSETSTSTNVSSETSTSTNVSSETSTTTNISSETSTSTNSSSETSTSTNSSSETSTSTNSSSETSTSTNASSETSTSTNASSETSLSTPTSAKTLTKISSVASVAETKTLDCSKSLTAKPTYVKIAYNSVLKKDSNVESDSNVKEHIEKEYIHNKPKTTSLLPTILKKKKCNRY